MDGLDLRGLQFDFDQTWSAIFLNPDGTIYARYGSRHPDGPMVTNSLEGLMTTMERVLAVHAAYPANREVLLPKFGRDLGYATPEDIPSRFTNRGELGRTRRGQREGHGCIHCHNVHEALNDVAAKESGQPNVFKYPFPENVGITLDTSKPAIAIAKVTGDSAAEKAGVLEGDEIVTVDGHSVLSIADFQFALHQAPSEGHALSLDIRRGGEEKALRLDLADGWKRNDYSWRRSLIDYPPRIGIVLAPAPKAQREQLGIPEGEVALAVKNITNRQVRDAGLQTGDVVVSYDGLKDDLSIDDLRQWLRMNHWRADSKLKVEVLRSSERLDLVLPLYDPASADRRRIPPRR